MAQQQQLIEAAERSLTGGASFGATYTEGTATPALPRDEALQSAINEATFRIEGLLASPGSTASRLLDRTNKELAEVVALLDGPLGRSDLSLSARIARKEADPGRLAKQERRRLRLEAEQIVLIGKAAEEDRRRTKEWRDVEAAGHAAQEARLLAQFRAEEAETAAAAERERFLAWTSKLGL